MDSINSFQTQLQSTEFLCSLAFLTDITNHFNVLNLSLQGKRQSISYLVRHVEGFYLKLVLLTECLQNNNFAYFLCCSVIKKEYSKADFIQFVSNSALLSKKFQSKFEDFQKLKIFLCKTISCK